MLVIGSLRRRPRKWQILSWRDKNKEGASRRAGEGLRPMRQSERLQTIALAKSDKPEEEYASSYLKLRLSEAEAEKQYLFEKIKLQESSRASQSSGGDPSLVYSKIRDRLHGRHGFRE
ncbi:hypothetical protein GQ457_05G004690 [Hibiscus cannabinus]